VKPARPQIVFDNGRCTRYVDADDELNAVVQFKSWRRALLGAAERTRSCKAFTVTVHRCDENCDHDVRP
jgi:hypothetical protein